MPTEWEEVLDHLDLTDEQFSANLQERIDEGFEMVAQNDRVVCKRSPIHGNGAFAARDIEGGEYAMVVQSYRRLTYAGAKVNHSHEPSCELVHTPSGHIFLRAILDIEEGDELTHDYRISYWRPGGRGELFANE